ncbi:MAG: hypothetical protein WED33_03155 [Bacteroidia bacterium]
MSEHHLHLLFNHFPIMGSFFGLIILITGMVAGNSIIRKIGYVVLIASALFTLPAFFTGEGAEEVVENLPGIGHDIIHEHEEIAELSLWLAEIMGISAFFSFMLEIRKHRLNLQFSILTLVLSIMCFGSMIRTGNSGGEIRRPEIRSDYQPSNDSQQDDHDHAE